MKKSNMVLVIAAIAGGALSFFAMRAFSPREAAPATTPAEHAGQPVAPLPSNEGALEEAIRFYRARVTRDPERHPLSKRARRALPAARARDG